MRRVQIFLLTYLLTYLPRPFRFIIFGYTHARHDSDHVPFRDGLTPDVKPSEGRTCYGQPIYQTWSLYVHRLRRHEMWRKM